MDFDLGACEERCESILQANLGRCREQHLERLRLGTHTTQESLEMLESCEAYFELEIQACVEECRKNYYRSLRQG